MALFLGVGYGIYRIKAEILLIATAFISGLIGYRLGYSWKEMQDGIINSVRQAMPAMLIVICVGLLIGSWIVSGTIPMLIFYGLKIISPGYFLVTACLVCSIVSLFTGTSWGTVGTIGIAFIGIANGLGIPLAPTAGAIITGAYFGDKISPFSDTTNLAPIAARSNLFDHIRHLLWTTVPAWLIGLLIYFLVGLQYHEQIIAQEQLDKIFMTLHAQFNFNIWLVLPLLIVLLFAIKKLPTIPGMLIASFTAAVLAIIFQKISITELLNSMTIGYTSRSGFEDVDKLLSRGGMMSMMGVTLIAFCAFAFAGIVQCTGMLQVILDRIVRLVQNTGMLIASTSVSSVIVAFITGSSFLSIIIPGELFAPAFRKRNLAAKNLSRTIEDSGTVVVPLVPWSMAGIFMSGTLGVATLDYFPWSFMCYLGIAFAWFYGFSGIGIASKIREDETLPGS
jgi:NhaC family Na+:H+ antiporter